ncbi:MAG: O-antigen ligase family protein [Gemmatimonadota bacterium]|nr:O-antigen ligase family protein [Gemmatimonadota bacterium]
MISSFSKVIVFALLLMLATRHARDLSLFIWAYVVACGLLIYMATFVFDLSGASGSANLRLSNLYTYDANDLGCVLMVGLPLSLLAFQTSRLPGRIISGVVIAGTGLAIARSGSRGALVGFVITGLMLLFVVRGVSVGRRAAVIAVVIGTILLSAPPGYWDQMRTIATPTADYNWQSKDGRKQVAKRGITYMMSSPIFGIGVDNFARAEGTISGKFDSTSTRGVRWSAAHNSFIEIGAELGIPGFIMFAVLVIGGCVSMIRLRRRLPERWLHGTADERLIYLSCVYLPASFVAFAVTGFFVSFAYIDPIYVLAAYVTGVYRCSAAMARVRPGGTSTGTGVQGVAKRRRGGGWGTLPPSAPPRITG